MEEETVAFFEHVLCPVAWHGRHVAELRLPNKRFVVIAVLVHHPSVARAHTHTPVNVLDRHESLRRL